MENTVGKVGLYLVNGTAGDPGAAGAPILHFSLLVNAAERTVSGQVRQTQALQDKTSNILVSNVVGQIHYTGLGQYTKIVSLQGSVIVSVPPPAIGSYLSSFDAVLAINDDWEGTGGWTLAGTSVDNAPVKQD